MSVADLLLEGVNLMLLGMGIVFTFLMLLVLGLNGMSWLAHRLAPEDAVAQMPARAATAGSVQDQELVAVISAAIQRYRSNNR